jgi:hypothetical protein
MTEVRNLYLSRCPCEENDDLNELEEMLKISLWTTNTTIKKIDYRITSGNLNPSSSEYEECSCMIGSEKGDISPEGARTDSTTPERGRHYKCNFKIWNNPELSKALESYFRKKNMIVEAFDSDV